VKNEEFKTGNVPEDRNAKIMLKSKNGASAIQVDMEVYVGGDLYLLHL
jgi:hypothetical protein